MTQTKKFNIGIIGPGIAFQQLHLPQITTREDVAIRWLAGTDLGRTSEAADAVAGAGLERPEIGTDFKGLLSEQPVDAVLVAVPIARTAEIVEAALESGTHVFAEKPLAVTSAGCRRLIEIASANSQVLFVGENFRYQKKFHEFRHLVDSGVIGFPKLYFLNDLHFTPSDGTYARTSWRQSGDHQGGYLIDGGTHIVAGLRSMVGRAVQEVHAVAAAVHPEYLSNQWDAVLINIVFSDGFVGHVALGYGVFDQESRTPKIYGTKGTLALTSSGIELWNEDGSQALSEINKKDTGFPEEWRLFLDAVAGDTNARLIVHQDALESVSDLAVLEAALTSVRTGQVVRLA